MDSPAGITEAEFFEGFEASRPIYEAVGRAVSSIGPAELRVTKSQIAFRRRTAFAWIWIPGRYLHREAAPLVLTFSFPALDPSPRWKQIVEPTPGRYTHHLELHSPADVDGEVSAWLRAAWTAAGPRDA